MSGQLAPIPAEHLHGSLRDPLLGTIGFLNEVMSRFPDAISFAPGAPQPDFLDAVDVDRSVRCYLDHRARSTRARGGDLRRQLLEYGPSRGLINDLVAEALRRDEGIDAAPEEIVVTAGAQEAMLLVFRALCGSPSDRVAVADPCFVGASAAVRLLDIALVPVRETPGGPDPEELRAACRSARAAGGAIRALYLAPDHSNPSGAVVDLAGRRQLLRLAEEEQLILVEDSAYRFTAPPGSALPSLKALDRSGRVIHVGTFAKLCAPGARVGYVVADQSVRRPDGRTHRLADDLAALKSAVTVNTSPIGQAVVGGMLIEAGGSLRELGRVRAEHYQRRLGDLLAALDCHVSADLLAKGVAWNRPAGGFFVRLRVPACIDEELLEWSGSQFGVLWTPMRPFHVGLAGNDEIRLSCSYLDRDEIEEGARRLARFLEALIQREECVSNARRTET